MKKKSDAVIIKRLNRLYSKMLRLAITRWDNDWQEEILVKHTSKSARLDRRTYRTIKKLDES